MRQIISYMQDYWATLGFGHPVPSSQLCKRFAALEVSVTQRCVMLAKRLVRGEAVSMIVDATGLSFGRASQWYEQKYSHPATRTPWRKMHLGIDADMNIHAIRITTTEVSDSGGMDAMLPENLPVDKVIARWRLLQHRAYRDLLTRWRDAGHSTACTRGCARRRRHALA
jgi:hypothetical protein